MEEDCAVGSGMAVLIETDLSGADVTVWASDRVRRAVSGSSRFDRLEILFADLFADEVLGARTSFELRSAE